MSTSVIYRIIASIDTYQKDVFAICSNFLHFSWWNVSSFTNDYLSHAKRGTMTLNNFNVRFSSVLFYIIRTLLYFLIFQDLLFPSVSYHHLLKKQHQVC